MDKVGEYSLINEIKNTFDMEERKGPGLKLSVQRINSGSPKPPPSSVFSGVGNSPSNQRKSRKSLFRSKTKGPELNQLGKKPKKDFKRVKSILKRGRTFGQKSDIDSLKSSNNGSKNLSRKVTFSSKTKGGKKYKKFRKSPYQRARDGKGDGGHKSSMKRNLFVKLTNDIWS